MNLIERAVSLLPKTPDERSIAGTQAQTRAGSATSDDPRPPTIERLVERLAEHTAGSPDGGLANHATNPDTSLRAAPAVPARMPEPLIIDIERLSQRGFITPSGLRTRTWDEFRVIKRPLLENAFGKAGRPAAKNGRRLMITSAYPREGKSYCAINLAMSIALERDQRVLLIDTDVARPSLLEEFGIPPIAGVMDWLIDGSPDLAELVRPTNVERLSLLPSGRLDTHSTEYLVGASMTQLLARLDATFPDHILIFDSPPLLVTTEAQALARHMGQVALVVEAGKTPQSAVTEALHLLQPCDIIGTVLNRIPNAKSSARSGYGYGYSQGEGP
jgi:exopolysaccharide/PEP-CTERM locus tyrosine autokinase